MQLRLVTGTGTGAGSFITIDSQCYPRVVIADVVLQGENAANMLLWNSSNKEHNPRRRNKL